MVSFRVRRPYFEAIKAGTKVVEVRRHTPYWVKVMNRGPREAVFVCGREVHRRAISVILRRESIMDIGIQNSLPPEMRGMVNEDVGKGRVIAFFLEHEIKRKRATMRIVAGPGHGPQKWRKRRRGRVRAGRQTPLGGT